jgi:hypothetical protein
MNNLKKTIFLILSFCLFTSCYENKSTDTYSVSFNDFEQKVAFLKKYLNLRTEIEDVEFHIKYHDNSSSIPGPSEWYYRVALKVNPDSLYKWNLTCNAPDTLYKYEEWENIIPSNKNWNLEGDKITCEDGYVLIPKKNIVLFLDYRK